MKKNRKSIRYIAAGRLAVCLLASLFVVVAACGQVMADSRLPPGSSAAGENQPTDAPARVMLDRGSGRFVGFVTPTTPDTIQVDMKFWSESEPSCAGAFNVENEGDGWGWYRMCADAARFGSLRLTGRLVAHPQSRLYQGTLSASDRGFIVDVNFGFLDGCVKEIGVRGVAAAYTFFAVDCTQTGGAQGTAEGEPKPFWPGGPTGQDVSNALEDSLSDAGGETGSDAGPGNSPPPASEEEAGSADVPLAVGTGSSRENTYGPIKGADDDLFPKSGFGFLKDLLPDNAAPLARIQLARGSPGGERISFEMFKACHGIPSEVSPTFCAMAKTLVGENLPITDYGFNGKYGVGRFEHDGYTWFVRLRARPDQRIEAEFTRTLLHVDSDLGVNPSIPDAPRLTDANGRRRPVATEDLYPLEGYGHLLSFIENRMPTSPARKNLLVQSGDVVFRSDQRLHIDDFGACPPGLDPRFCRETQAALYKSWPLEDYLFNGQIGTAEVTYGSARYIVVLSKSKNGRIRSQFYLADNDIAARFATPLGPPHKGQDAPASDLACVSQFHGKTKFFETVTNHRGVPVSWCASNGSCADGSDLGYLHALCEIALREEQRISGRWANFDEVEVMWGKACAIPGSEQAAESPTPYYSDRFDSGSIYFGITAPYFYFSQSGSPMDRNDRPYFEPCSDCQTVAKLACEFFGP